jgi:ribose transport system permease protein
MPDGSKDIMLEEKTAFTAAATASSLEETEKGFSLYPLLVNIWDLFKQQGLLIGFIILLFIMSFFAPRILTLRNIMLVLTQVSIMGVMACGVTFVLIGGNFDLSIGSQLSFTAVLVVDLHDKIGPIPAILVALAAGIAIGAFNGYLVGFQKLTSLIVTLGMLPAVQALTLIYSGGQYSQIQDPEAWFSVIGRGFLWGIPMPFLIFGLTAIVSGIVLRKSVYGRSLYAVGGNRTASWFAGIRDDWVTFFTFIITGFTAAMGGILMGSRLMSAQNYLGQNYELQVLSAVVLGGTSLYGGSGSIFKTVVGVLILGFLANGFIHLGLPYYTQMIAQWVIIIGAVWMDVAAKRESS